MKTTAWGLPMSTWVAAQRCPSALMVISRSGQSALAAELLLAASATVDATDRHGNTALFDAVFDYRGDPATLRMLLAAGADPEQANAKGVSPRGLADRIGNYDAALHVPGAGGHT
ncbi:hypothetical protein ACGFRG_00225 [Streptomyces sp. NPDC048696]|uniref:hypothetical protein n=1 Tax=Streptomyces sp. NPDC048696 TaxID=3365585 RepID=UPI003714997C